MKGGVYRMLTIVNMKPNLIKEIKMQVQRELGLAFCIYICSAIVYLICIL